MKYLRHAREKKQLSQDKLAELSGVPQNTISLIERGIRLKPHKSTLDKLARVLDVNQPAMLAMDIKGPTFADLIKGTAEERQAYFEAKRKAGRFNAFKRNLERIVESSIKDSRGGEPHTRAQLESAVLLGYALAFEDATQLELDEHSEREEEVTTNESTRVLTASS